LVNLTDLRVLRLEDTQLCAPTDDVFQAWLDGIDTKRGVVNCGPLSTAIELSVNQQTISEDAGATEITVTATLDERALSEDTTVLLSIGPSSTATRDVDYRVSFRRLVIPADNIAGSTLLLVEPIDDAEVEGDETIVLIGVVDGLMGDEVAITIIDDDESLDNPDRAVLVALYAATDGDDWTNDTNWLSDRPLGEWHGVTTNANGRVTRLDLDDNALSGTLPSELGNLTNLQWLDLGGNQLSGELPSSLGNLTDLRLLWLGGNAFSGSFPSWLVNLTNLQQLQLAVNQFSGELPSWLGTLTNLQDLRLQHNQFSGSLPPELGNLTRLVRLYLHENKALLNPLPLSLVKLTNLQQLYLDNTQLCAPTDAAFQTWLGGIEDKVGVRDCDEPGDPDPTSPDRAVLVALYEATNGDNWTNDTNWLSDRPLSEWRGVTTDENGRVASLGLVGNQLSGTIPKEIGQLQNLTQLWLDGNQLSGTIPKEIGQLQNLIYLVLADNQLSGTIPKEIGQLQNLGTLWLDGNQLSGAIPRELGNLTKLERLYLGGNQLSGTLPESLRNLANLEVLWLHGTQLCAPLDAAFQTWLGGIDDKQGVVNCDDGEPSTAIVLSVNPQTIREGSDETEITATATLNGQALSEDTTVDLNINYATSTAIRDVDYTASSASWSIVIPAGSIAGSTALWAWAVADNIAEGDETIVLIGAVDGLMGDEAAITIIDDDETPDNPDRAVLVALYEATNGDNWTNNTNWLSDRPLGEWYGVSTDDDGRVTSLELGGNGLSGSVPSSLGNLTNLQGLGLSGNQLSGALPSSLGNLTNLQGLALSGNQLSGALPSSLGNLTNLQGLWLHENELSGALPSSLGNLTQLEVLELSRNQLSGALPQSLVNLTNLQYLYLHNTQLCAPTDAAFQSWLDGIDDKLGVEYCGDESGGSTSVTIPDANLRALIEGYFDKASGAPITEAEMATLTRLEAQNKGISDLTGLEYAINLTWLDFSEQQVASNTVANNNSFSDLSPLANLTRLTWLDLSYNDNISDISSLSGLTNLTYLNLSTNWAISDFSSLSGLTNLTELYLFGISDVSALSGLTNLTKLSLNSTDISDISPLSGLTNLTELHLDGPSTIGTDISDISPLSGLTNLTELHLGGHKIPDISPLSGLTNLTELYFSFAPISDISPLSGLTRLTRLSFHVSNISDISPLSGLANLTWLNFTFGDFSDISPLSGLTNLTYLRLIHCKISDLAPLVANTGLDDGDEVNVENNPLSATSRNTHIPALQARGVNVRF